ncbi:AAA family ATPase [Sabulicella rubraurantiaca]|uniref:AAA family ATPase n=1 Tax=Sabulicella rubraurantiaca TaxID=2811429 RepID=UPI001A9627C8|nr:hypothetical protein [Sabulicella rubraurantiaca]
MSHVDATLPLAVEGDRLALAAWIADEASEDAVRAGLPDIAAGSAIRRGNIRAAIKALAQQPTPRLLLVDIEGDASPLQALDALSAVCAPDVRVIVLGDRSDIGFYRQLTRELGVDEYLPKPLTRDTISGVLRRRMSEAPEGEGAAGARGGRLVAVMGVRGGAGGTTIAANLAMQIASDTRGHVCLLDMNLRGGNAALLLGVQPSGALRTALEQPERADALFIDRVAVPVTERLRVIASEEPLGSQPAPTEEGVRHLLDLLLQRFNVVVADVALPPSAAERTLLSRARQRVLVMTPEVTQIRDMMAARTFLSELPGDGSTISVLNRANARWGLETKLLEQGLGGKPDIRLPDLPVELAKAANIGRAAVLDYPAWRKALAPLVQEATGHRLVDAQASGLGQIFKGLFRR